MCIYSVITFVDPAYDLLNAGFIFLRPTKASILTYALILKTCTDDPNMDDQGALNDVMHSMSVSRKIKYRQLPVHQFVSGKAYYEEARRYFADTAAPCESCIAIHNNWIVSKAAKVYRFREMGQWVYNEDEYYTNKHERFLTYTLTAGEDQLASLINALAYGTILNRTVVLPRFWHNGRQVPLNSLLYISNLDHHFPGSYKESSYPQHIKVPRLLKQQFRDADIIEPTHALTDNDILLQYSKNPDRVIHFRTMCDMFSGFLAKQDNVKFRWNIQHAFKPANYRQYPDDPFWMWKNKIIRVIMIELSLVVIIWPVSFH